MTLYFSNAVDNVWDTLGNWWQDSDLSIPAASIPDNGDNAILRGDVATGPSVLVALSSITVSSIASLYDFGAATYDSLTVEGGVYAVVATSGPLIMAGGIIVTGSTSVGALSVTSSSSILCNAATAQSLTIALGVTLTLSDNTGSPTTLLISDHVVLDGSMDLVGSSLTCPSLTLNAVSNLSLTFGYTTFTGSIVSTGDVINGRDIYIVDSALSGYSYTDTATSTLNLSEVGNPSTVSFSKSIGVTTPLGGVAIGGANDPSGTLAVLTLSNPLEIRQSAVSIVFGGQVSAPAVRFFNKTSLLNCLSNGGTVGNPTVPPLDVIGAGLL